MPMSASMQKSLSTGSLRAAAEMKLTHIPKRATQHGVHLCGYEVLPPQLKTGQVRVDRQVYSEEAKTNQSTYLDEDLPNRSIYHRSIGSATAPEDYCNPVKPMRPGQAPSGSGHHKVAHWRSTSHSSLNHDAVHGAVQHRQHGPSYQALNPPTCLGGGGVLSSYGEEYGHYGSDPRHKVQLGSGKMPVLKSALTYGTPKGTMHMPGYQGFLPTNTANPKVAAIENGQTLRSTDKTNLTATFHTNVLNYSGHVPLNPNNDRGGVNTNVITEMGRSYRMPPSC